MPKPRMLARVRTPWLLAATLCAACGAGGEEAEARPEGTLRMAALLERIAAESDPEENVYLNSARLERLLAQEAPGDDVERLKRGFLIGLEYLRSGRTEEAIEQFGGLRSRMALRDIGPFLGLAWLRLGEQENCQLRHTADSCLVPIRAEGVHGLPRGSRGAIEVFEAVLRESPDDLSTRWLLNLAYMTLGEHPQGVPEAWRIPAEAFASEHDVGRFLDVAPRLGLDVLGLSGGVALEDFDGDGHLDVLCSSWGLRDPVRFFASRGDGTFEDRTAAAGLEGITGGLNLNHADYDGDGDADVLILRGAWLGFPPSTDGGEHPNSLLRNRGDGTFEDVTEAAGLLSLHPTQNAAWADYDGDGLLDLFVGNESFRDARHPCELFRNQGDGTFREVAAEVGLDVVGMIKGSAWGDFDDDGDPDLYLSDLRGPNRLMRNDEAERGGARVFRDVAAEAGVTEPRRSFPTWWWDYDNDGRLDLFVSGYGVEFGAEGVGVLGSAGSVAADYLGLPHGGQTPRLYRNRGDGTFEDRTVAAGLDHVLLTMGCNFGDLDGDGWPDAYLGTGDPDFRSVVPNRMFRGDGAGGFQDVTTSGGFGHVQKGHAIAFGDVDGDGDQDVYAVMGGAYEGDVFQNALFENPGHGSAWVTLELVGTRSNRSAVGARIEVRAATPRGERSVHAVVGTGGSFGSQSLRQELGLGDATEVLDVRVAWPGTPPAQAVSCGPVGLRAVWRIVEGAEAPVRVERAAFRLGGSGAEGAHAGHEAHGH